MLMKTLTAAAAALFLLLAGFASAQETTAEPSLVCEVGSYEPISCATPDGIALQLWGPYAPSSADEAETGLNAAAMQVLSGFTPEDIAALPKRSAAGDLLVVKNVQWMDDDGNVVIHEINVSADYYGAWQWFRADTGEAVGPKHCFGPTFKRFCHGQNLKEVGLTE